MPAIGRTPAPRSRRFLAAGLATGVLALLVAFAGEAKAQPEPFTLIVLPDTQHYSDEHQGNGPYPEVFNAQTAWIVAEQQARNIVYVLHEGDFVNGQGGILVPEPGELTAMESARTSMDILDQANIPYAIAVGNHDYDAPETRDTTTFDASFRAEDYMDSGFFRGTKDPGTLANSYHLFTAGGTRWMILSLEFGATTEAMNWANAVVGQHPNHRVIVLTHTHTYDDDTLHGTFRPGHLSLPTGYANPPFLDPHDAIDPAASDVWTDFVSQHPNISFVLSGHINVSNTDRGAGRALEGGTDMVGVHGNTIYQLLANFQQWYTGGVPGARIFNTGYLRIMEFDPAAGTVDVKTYSPTEDDYVSNSDNEFTITGADLSPLAPPTADAVVAGPGVSSRVGHDVEFVASYSDTDPAGWRDLRYAQLLIGDDLTSANTASVLYLVDDGWLRLREETGWGPAIPIDSPGELENDLVVVDAGKSRVETSGETLQLTLNLRFKDPLAQFPSLKVYLRAMDDQLQWSDWEHLGSWAVEDAELTPVAPEVGPLTADPGGGSSTALQDVNFYSSYTDANGWQDILHASFLVGEQLNGIDSCYLRYFPALDQVRLRSDDGSSWFVGTLGAAQILQNSQCWLDLSQVAVTTIGDTLTVKWKVGFYEPFAALPSLRTYLRAKESNELDSGWVETANWRVDEPLESNVNPVADSVETLPADGTSHSNLEVVFESTYFDANGWDDLRHVYLHIKDTVSPGSEAARLLYSFEDDVVRLRNDDGTAWSEGVAPGSAQILENSQVRVHVEKMSVETVGGRARVVWNLEFLDPYINTLDVPSYTIYQRAIDWDGQSSGWIAVGSWVVEP